MSQVPKSSFDDVAPDDVEEPIKFMLPGLREWVSLKGQETSAGEAIAKDERLETFLLTSLQMQNLLVLAGSGTSLNVGGPTMPDLWDACINANGEMGAVVLQRLRYGGSETERNIEELLSRCDAHLQVNADDDAVSAFRHNAIETILRRCRRVGEPDHHDLGAHKEFLRRLARRRARDPRLKLFTTNYDLCFERAAGELGLVALDGFSFSQPRRFDPGFFDHDIVRRNMSVADGPHYVPGVFHFMKLHGSVDWAFAKSGGVLADPGVGAPEACLVYPTQQKYRFSFQQPHLELIAQFLTSLRQANACLLAVGCGFNDDHLSEPIFSALESNPHLRVIVASPDAVSYRAAPPNRGWERLRALSKRGVDLAFVQVTFASLATLIPDLRALTPSERFEQTVTATEPR